MLILKQFKDKGIKKGHIFRFISHFEKINTQIIDFSHSLTSPMFSPCFHAGRDVKFNAPARCNEEICFTEK